MDSVVKDEKKHDQRLEETMKIFEDGGDQCLQKTIKIKKRPPRCHDDDDDYDDEGGCVQEKKKLRMNKTWIRQGARLPMQCQSSLSSSGIGSGLWGIQQSFLTPEESERLNSGGNGKKCANMEVMLIEPSLHRETISLRKWNMKKASGNSTSMCVLVTNWKSVTERNSMKEDETVQLWSFRIKSRLGFALVKRRLQDDPRNRSLRGILDS
ncbi:hypothetical protein VitviT2T_019595 [Vitis vinifera]|uniref:B3 domain-containing protein n=1 Tax=Vitis vinifera TaxID=29760 RepID=A0ABY9D1H6_VITVI|nr:hypothetical protein VitviT2T_019595 [Vitis vinifera]